MSRSKKSRKPGSAGVEELIVTRNRTESDIEGRLRKRLKKRKGLKTGNRNAVEAKAEQHHSKQKRDPRIGSKKPIPLIVETKAKPNKAQRRVSAEQELEQIQNDAQLNILIDRLENGEKLGAGLQSYVDQKLNRLEQLMKQLGIEIEDEDFDDEEDFVEEQEVAEVAHKSANKAKKTKSEDDLLDEFDNINLDEFKGF